MCHQTPPEATHDQSHESAEHGLLLCFLCGITPEETVLDLAGMGNALKLTGVGGPRLAT